LIKNYFKQAIGFLLILLLAQCKQEYIPQVEENNTRQLVVEGYINSGPGATTIQLSRSSDLEDTVLTPEFNAQVIVEGDDGSSVPLFENGNGEYIIGQLILDNAVKYRVHITTTDGKQYASEYTPVKYTPLIDSITWQRENDGLRLYTNGRDPQNDAKYYQWKYEETWEFHSAYHTTLKYVIDPVTTNPIGVAYRYPDMTSDTTIYKCWNTLVSSTILLGTTENLVSNVVFLPIQYIEPNSEKLSVLYSINLRQYAISKENYLFLQKMKKNTEQLGTIFDPQPSEISGNIHCLTNSGEIAIGFIEVIQEQVKRIFISNSQVPDWNYNPGCTFVEITDDPLSIQQYGIGLIPTIYAKVPLFGPKTFYASTPSCVDCTLRGVHQKPDFWP